MNKEKLNSIVHKVSEETGIVYNSILVYYFMEDILLKISKSKYKDNLIFKGGFLLSNLVGISSRATVDMDFIIKNEQLSKSNIERILTEIINVSDNNISYEINNIKNIREQDAYGGLRVLLLARFENIRQHIPIDIATGDIITPHPIDYEYKSIFNQETIPVIAYTIENMIAEKIETIYSRGFLNSRSKDYFDLYLIYKLKGNQINIDILKDAINNTFLYRNTEYNIDKLKTLINRLSNNPVFVDRWATYRKKNNFVGGLEFEEVLNVIMKLLILLE